jgi:hypothetical protein
MSREVILCPEKCLSELLMQGDSEARTVAELRAMFRDAGDLRPALLLLRNAEALSGAQGNMHGDAAGPVCGTLTATPS